MSKYEPTLQTKEFVGTILHRIRALVTGFADVHGNVVLSHQGKRKET